MTYRGHVKNGMVLLDESVQLIEGSAVEVTVPAPAEAGTELRESPTLYETLEKFVGIFEGLPPDLAENHDHYVHGAPKRQ